MKLAAQLPFADCVEDFRVTPIITRRTIDPESNRTTVKLDASIAPLPNARRQSTELAANAINAIEVSMNVFINDLRFILDTIQNYESIYSLDCADYLRK
jgi:SMC interacting uncharacterized protein involved in chromosome segregation